MAKEQYKKRLLDRLLEAGIDLPKSIIDLPKIILDESHDYVCGLDEDEQSRVLYSLPHIPPFDQCWMEIDYPDSLEGGLVCYKNDQDSLNDAMRTIGECHRLNPCYPSAPDWFAPDYILEFVLGYYDKITQESDLPHVLYHIVGNEKSNHQMAYFTWHEDCGPMPTQEYQDWYNHKTGCIMSSFRILHIKNIKLKDQVPPLAINRHFQKKVGMPLPVYKTLVLTKPGSDKEYKLTGNHSGKEMPWHLCRSHIRHVSEERPLFGRAGEFGDYIIPAHAKGKKENGVIHKDYRVKVDESKMQQAV